MKCPYCDKEMTLGYIQSRDGVVWTPKARFVSALNLYRKGITDLANGATEYSGTVYSYKCDDCKKVLIDYSKPKNK